MERTEKAKQAHAPGIAALTVPEHEQGADMYKLANTLKFIITHAQVVVRVRPVLPHEDVEHVAVSCSPEADKVQVMLPDKSITNKQQLPGASRSGAKSYSFDACLPGKTTQVQRQRCCWCHNCWQAIICTHEKRNVHSERDAQ
eukprot:359824-Pelagomonas_calceolata.AAC.3